MRTFILFFYFLVSTSIFIYFISQKPVFIYDQTQYYGLSTNLIKNHFNIFTTNFHDRTFVYPTFLALVRILFFWINNLYPIYFVNLLLFHGVNMLIFLSLSKLSKKVSVIFLLASSFNVINLSIMQFSLTETLTVFFISLIFYLLVNLQKTRKWFLALGLVSSLLVFTRPNTILLFLFMAIFLAVKYRPRLLFFLIGSLLIFSIGFINTYFVSGKIHFFSDDVLSDGLYVYKYGINFFKKTETVDPNISLNKKFFYPDMLFTNLKNLFLDHNCFSATACQLSYLTQNPQAYFSMILAHLFTAFDNTYLINTYIKDLSATNNFVRLANYWVLSSAIIYIFFFKKKPTVKSFVNLAVIMIVVNVLPLLPGMIEPRYATPIYPLVLALFSFYLANLKTIPTRQKINYLSFQLVMILLFFMTSNAVLATLHIGRWGY